MNSLQIIANSNKNSSTMKTIIFRILISSCLLLTAINISAQSAKKYYKTAKEFSKSGSFDEAIENYTKAIDLDPQFTKAYIERASVYEELGHLTEAAEDYKTLSDLLPTEYIWLYKTASINYMLNKYIVAITFLNSASELEEKDSKILELKMRCDIALSNFKSALTDCDGAIQLNPSAENYYYHGIIQKKLENYLLSEADFNASLKVDPNYINSYIGLGVVKLKQNKTEDALLSVNKAIQIDNKNKEALMLRSQIYKKKSEIPSAINDLSTLVQFYPDDEEILYQRGMTYYDNNQFQNALADFSKVLLKNEKNKSALYKRGNTYEKLGKNDEALKDYEKLLSIKIAGDDSTQIYKIAAEKLYELNRENDSPIISIVSEKLLADKSIGVPDNIEETQLIIKVKDKNKIQTLIVDGNNLRFNADSLSSGFTVTINIKNKKKITIESEDIYKNKAILELKLTRNETIPPTIAILTPYVSEKNEIFVDPQIPEFLIEGRVMDDSKIASIEINRIQAKFNNTENNPKFSVKINPTNKDQLEFIVKDIYGNAEVKTYKINRNVAELINNNPMGNTWVVFIENTEYNAFTSVKGPEKDVSMMKSALSKYQINNILHKKNMSKQQMEKFFNTELRDLVRDNQVNSILIWYAGLGKYINENSYWIPTDAKRDSEMSYFNINSLKSSMQAYTKNITHTLIVTDACETGPSFYMSMRSLPTERDCNNPKATKFKSSQVFTSAGYGLADENTQFTKTFANSLNFNNNGCIPIDKIVIKVSSVVQQNDNQKPKFGKIAGFEDENGTFIFIKK